jgi:hypothetical protein
MSGALKRAKLVPYDKAGSTLQTDQAIKFDFNPETLTLKISTGQQQDKSRRGRQQVQSVGASAATLSFDAIFDTTRPKDNDVVADGDLNDDTALDVRKRTKPIADLLAAVPQPGGGSGKGAGGGKTDKSPSRVQFQWGNILFDGVITSHQETFDFFAPSGVPLRSKISLTLSEQNFNYVVNADDLSRATADPAPATARDAARSRAGRPVTGLLGQRQPWSFAGCQRLVVGAAWCFGGIRRVARCRHQPERLGRHRCLRQRLAVGRWRGRGRRCRAGRARTLGPGGRAPRR